MSSKKLTTAVVANNSAALPTLPVAVLADNIVTAVVAASCAVYDLMFLSLCKECLNKLIQDPKECNKSFLVVAFDFSVREKKKLKNVEMGNRM